MGDVFHSSTLAAWLFLLPAVGLLTLFVFAPIVYVIYLSFTSGSLTQGGMAWVGGQNYQRLFQSPDFWQVVGNTLYFTGATVLPTILMPLALAVGLNQAVFGRSLLRTAYFLPTVTSIVAAGLGFRWLFQTDGLVNHLLAALGIPAIAWLSDPSWAMPVLILLSSWKQLGFNLVVFLAGLQTIPGDRYEAALLDGANPWQQFRYITLPGLQPTLILVLVTTTIFTLRSFEQVYVVTGGGPLNTTNLLVFYIYQQAFAFFDIGYAAAAATVLLVVTLGLTWLQLRTRQDPHS
ncbi:carbohydrate ABC transporter permease [Parathermosynechococcus lividus]